MNPRIPLLCALPLLGGASAIHAKKADKPNVLVIVTDDQSYSALGCYGNPAVSTPNMDRLARQGMSFTQNHVMGSCGGAVSMPSRAMLLTGKSLFDLHQDGRYIPTEDKTMPELFRENGYETFATGKWHNGKESFHRSFTCGDNIFFGGMNAYKTGGQFNPLLHHFDPTGAYKNGKYTRGFSSVFFADAAVKYLDGRSRRDKPFMMYVAFTSPHDPRTPPPDYGRKYDADSIELPLNFLRRHPFDNGELRIRDEVLIPIPRDPDTVRREIAAYYGMVSEVDYQIGRIIDALEASGQADNTIIVFTSDNGLAVGQHGLLGKQNLYEHSVRTPLIITGPGIPQGATTDAPNYLLDIFPTLCDLTGIEKPDGIYGRSMAPTIADGTPVRDHIYLGYNSIQRSIKKDGFKLIMYNVKGEQRIQLFDLKHDPWETDDLAGVAAYKDKIAELTKLLHDRMRASGDFCDPDKTDWGYPNKVNINKVKP